MQLEEIWPVIQHDQLRRHVVHGAAVVHDADDFGVDLVLGRDVQAAMGTDAGRQVWVDIEQELQRFQNAGGLRIPGEALIGVGAK